jgi:hypothetical protein
MGTLLLKGWILRTHIHRRGAFQRPAHVKERRVGKGAERAVPTDFRVGNDLSLPTLRSPRRGWRAEKAQS